MPIEKKCKVCGSSFTVPPCRVKTASTCSNICAVAVRAKSRERKVLRKCLNCGKEFSLPQSHVDRRIYCSNECRYGSVEWRGNISDRFIGDSNPQWRGGETNQSNGYIYARTKDHPFRSNNYMLKHRLVMEEWLREEFPESPFLVRQGENLYLSPDALIHHINRNRRDNRRRNLIVCSVGSHLLIHRGIMPEVGAYWPPSAEIVTGRAKPIVLAEGPGSITGERKDLDSVKAKGELTWLNINSFLQR